MHKDIAYEGTSKIEPGKSKAPCTAELLELEWVRTEYMGTFTFWWKVTGCTLPTRMW